MTHVVDAHALRRLWISVLITAAKDADAADKEVRVAAEQYLLNNRLEIGSVRWICEVLDINYERVRSFLCSRSGRQKLRRAMGHMEAREDSAAKDAA